MSGGYEVRITPTAETPRELVELISKDEETAGTKPELEDLLDIYGQQLAYFDVEYPGSYFIAAYNSADVYLGGVFLFLRTGAPGVNPEPPGVSSYC